MGLRDRKQPRQQQMSAAERMKIMLFAGRNEPERTRGSVGQIFCWCKCPRCADLGKCGPIYFSRKVSDAF